ncbi:isoleucine--tRNA ligase [candidate division KSB1 bacterium]|nr:isoleucine--tRNA ligase [candidate division KSB1 bacterium]
MYKPLPEKLAFPELEKTILDYWKKNRIFERSVSERGADRPFVFYEGPPTANGRPGIHHVISRTVKDAVCRLKTMQGFRVERKAGWDTHGLPVEIEVEKQLGLDGKEQVLEYGVAEFNAKCRESVWVYKKEWDELTHRMGYWIDLDHPYITYTNDYIESVWWILKEIWKKGLIYLGHKILPYCPRCETPLSSHEVSQGYVDVEDPSIFVKARIMQEENTFFLVWTTTPWTLLSNVALALNPEVKYVKVSHREENLILAEARLSVLDGDYEILESFTGQDLAGLDYEPFFPYIVPDKKAHYTVLGDFVTTTDGSGIVHIAPAFGEDDYQLGVKYDLPVIRPVDQSGQFTAEITPWAGRFVKDADKDIIIALKKKGTLYKTQKIVHSYPHCWRCKTPLLYYARESWYIKTTAVKERLMANNDKIAWYPREVGEGRFGEWLKNNIDWSLSRDRFWGTPLPIWQCDSCDHELCVGSIQELRELGKNVPEDIDLHKPHVDAIVIPCDKCGGRMLRVPEVIDCWFDSGSMPYAQFHYPFENQEIFAGNFPSDFISEGVDQTRGWFYSLLAISTILFDQPAYKTCLSLELILDKDGQKMSKTRGNTVNPFDFLDQDGADALRWYLLTVSPPWVPTRFDPEGVREVTRKFLGTLTNTYSFFVLYANIDGFIYRPAERLAAAKRSELDRWVLAALGTLVRQVNESLQHYDLTRAARKIAAFVGDDLSNWYVRRSRRRFWKSEMGVDKQAAFQTLYECLLVVSKLLAPFVPFVAERLYLDLTQGQEEANDSVHLELFPQPGDAPADFEDELLETRMDLVRRVVFLGRSLRNEAVINVRQPLGKLIVVAHSDRRRELIQGMENLILDELNVKAIDFVADENVLLVRKAEPVFKKLGPKFGRLANKAAEMLRSFEDDDIEQLLKKGEKAVVIEGHEAAFTPEDLQIITENRAGLVAGQDGDLTVALETEITQELRYEGLAREFVNRVQNMRKEGGLEVTDRIRVWVQASPLLGEAIEKQADYVRNETLCEKLIVGEIAGEIQKDWKIGQEITTIGLEKV